MSLLNSGMRSLRKTGRSFRFAFRGVWLVFRHENNTRIHLLATVAVVCVGWWLKLTYLEWAVIVTQIGLVWAAEAMNTAIERLVDLVSPGRDPRAGAVKDIAAGAVLLIAIAAAVVGCIIFGRKIFLSF